MPLLSSWQKQQQRNKETSLYVSFLSFQTGCQTGERGGRPDEEENRYFDFYLLRAMELKWGSSTMHVCMYVSMYACMYGCVYAFFSFKNTNVWAWSKKTTPPLHSPSLNPHPPNRCHWNGYARDHHMRHLEWVLIHVTWICRTTVDNAFFYSVWQSSRELEDMTLW